MKERFTNHASSSRSFMDTRPDSNLRVNRREGMGYMRMVICPIKSDYRLRVSENERLDGLMNERRKKTQRKEEKKGGKKQTGERTRTGKTDAIVQSYLLLRLSAKNSQQTKARGDERIIFNVIFLVFVVGVVQLCSRAI